MRFEPILQYRLWGGEHLPKFLHVPDDRGPFDEAWMLSDRKEYASRVADGSLKGMTISQLIENYPKAMLGRLAGQFRRFPLLLKFLDVRQMLSVQVHPKDGGTDLLPEGESGKTEAWVVLRAEADSRIYAGLKPDVTADNLRSLSSGTVDNCLASFAPAPSDGVFIEAGTVHSLGGGVLVFEIQENSDVTFRLYDWDHVDPRTGHKRPLQLEQALAAVNFGQGVIEPLRPSAAASPHRELMFDCRHFILWRIRGDSAFTTGAIDEPRVLVCLEGAATLLHEEGRQTMRAGEVVLLPASIGVCQVQPEGSANVLEIAIPEAA
jgi:mannose-6-phosphate isomerase